MAKKRDEWSMEEWRDYYENLRQKAYNNYQDTGMARFDSQERRYSVIVEAFDGYLENKSEVDTERARRLRNIEAYADRLKGKDIFTQNDVKRILYDISTF